MNTTKSMLELNAAAALAGLLCSPSNDTQICDWDHNFEKEMFEGEKEFTFPMKVSEDWTRLWPCEVYVNSHWGTMTNLQSILLRPDSL